MPNKVVYFENATDSPVATTCKGVMGRIRLWKRGDRIETREGTPIIPPVSEWPRLISMGIRPVYQSMDAVVESHVEGQTNPFEPPPPVVVIPPEPEPPKVYSTDPENPDPLNPNLCWQKSTGEWVFNLDGKTLANPASLKRHITKEYGAETTAKITWHKMPEA